MEVLAFYCPNPDCPCNEATLLFYEADGEFRKTLFKVNINYLTWQLVFEEIYEQDEDYSAIIQEFMEGLDDRIKTELLAGKKEVTVKEHVLREGVDYSGFSIDSLICYTEIYDVPGYEEWIFKHEDSQYVAVDYYCANPACKCTDVLLDFIKLESEDVMLPSTVLYKLDYMTDRKVIEDKGLYVGTRLAEGLFKSFKKCLGHRGNDVFIERKAKIDKWSKKYLLKKPVSRGPKVGRNEPCPCGSGKKYKKCCG